MMMMRRRQPRIPPFDLLAYSSVFIDKDLEHGDKIVLHQDILNKLMRNFVTSELPSPLLFKIRNKTIGRHSHVGVLEFSAPRNQAFLPRWLMDSLLLNDGAEVSLQLVYNLKRLTFAKFRPHSPEFFQIPDPKRTLEHALRNFTCLTVDDTIRIHHGINVYDLDVIELRPGNAGHLIDAELQVEFEDTVSAATTASADAQVLEMGGHGHGDVVKAGGHVYFRVKVTRPDSDFIIDVHQQQNDRGGGGGVDVYVSTATQTPTRAQFMWSSSGNEEEHVRVRVRHNDPNFIVSWYYIGVHSAADIPFEIRCVYGNDDSNSSDGGGDHENSDEDHDDQKSASSSLRKSSAGGGNVVGTNTAPVDENSRQCDNCHAWIGRGNYDMHSLRCARTNWRCADCGKVMPRAAQAQHRHCPKCDEILNTEVALQRHFHIRHEEIVCACGKSVEPRHMHAHRTNECDLRMVACKYCQLPLHVRDKEEHQGYCGSKTKRCELCGTDITLRGEDQHKAIAHNINPFDPPPPPLLPSVSPSSFLPTDMGGAAAMVPDDVALRAAVAESLRTAPAHHHDQSHDDAHGDNDMALQLALAESMANAARQQQAAPAAAAAAAAAAPQLREHDNPFRALMEGTSSRQPIVIDGDDDEDVGGGGGGGEDDVFGEGDGLDDWGADDDVGGGGGSGIYECPLCMKIFANHLLLEAHLNICIAAHED